MALCVGEGKLMVEYERCHKVTNTDSMEKKRELALLKVGVMRIQCLKQSVCPAIEAL